MRLVLILATAVTNNNRKNTRTQSAQKNRGMFWECTQYAPSVALRRSWESTGETHIYATGHVYWVRSARTLWEHTRRAYWEHSQRILHDAPGMLYGSVPSMFYGYVLLSSWECTGETHIYATGYMYWVRSARTFYAHKHHDVHSERVFTVCPENARQCLYSKFRAIWLA